jgi:hypothetical protein
MPLGKDAVEKVSNRAVPKKRVTRNLDICMRVKHGENEPPHTPLTTLVIWRRLKLSGKVKKNLGHVRAVFPV